ncbi:MAG: hypothetical protein ACREE9_22830 [Stellaceae bacterium]
MIRRRAYAIKAAGGRIILDDMVKFIADHFQLKGPHYIDAKTESFAVLSSTPNNSIVCEMANHRDVALEWRKAQKPPVQRRIVFGDDSDT